MNAMLIATKQAMSRLMAFISCLLLNTDRVGWSGVN